MSCDILTAPFCCQPFALIMRVEEFVQKQFENVK